MKEDINIFAPPAGYMPFYLNMSGISYCDGSYMISRAKSNITVIEYVTEGTGTVTVNGKEYHPSAGDIYILHQNSRHFYHSDSKEPWTKMFFNIRGRLIEEILTEYSLADKALFENAGLEKEFREILDLSFDRKSRTDEEIFNLCAVKFLELIIKLAQKYRTADENKEMAVLKEYILSHTDKIIKNSELAALIYRSEDYCIKEFSKCYGITPYEYQLSCKFKTAKTLLTSTVMPIREIAERLGYFDQHYFSNIFKKRCGCSPKEYRKNKLNI